MNTCLSAPSRALRDAVAGLFAGAPQPGAPTIGIELELIPYRIADHGVVPIDELRAALRGLSGVTFEPGGQLELNPPPRPSVTAACAQLARLVARIDARLHGIGVAVAATGLNPWHTVDQLGLQLRTDRYLAMDAHFERLGPAGRAFMRQTAATQICVGLATGDDGLGQWRAANLVAPVLAAMFANTPVPGARTAICRAADPARSRHGDPPLTIDDYAEFADRAEPLDQTLRRGRGDRGAPQHVVPAGPAPRQRTSSSAPWTPCRCRTCAPRRACSAACWRTRERRKPRNGSAARRTRTNSGTSPPVRVCRTRLSAAWPAD